MDRKRMMVFGAFLLAAALTGCGAEAVTETEQSTVPAAVTENIPETETTPETAPVDPLQAIIDQMSIEERVGQIFLARCPEENAAEDVSTYQLGGYILFGRDFEGQNPQGVRETIASYQNEAKVPLLIAVDEEGGTVNRVSMFRAFREKPFASPRDYFASGGMDAVIGAETEKAELLKSLGINVNMAPVCDITTKSRSFMYARSLGQSPETTGEFANRAMAEMEKCNIGPVLKHFPGYGNNADTHEDVAVDSRSLEELENCDLIPFQMGIDSGCNAILMSHNIVTAMDSTYPVSLSPAAHRYLRNMGFEGVIVTDELSMGAVAQAYGAEEAAVLAVLAGNDLLCVTDYAIQYVAVRQAVLDGRISMEILDHAVYRVLRWKQQLGLI